MAARELLAAVGVGLFAYAAYRAYNEGAAPSYSDVQSTGGALSNGATRSSTSSTSDDLDTLARTIWGEARGAGYDAQVGVGSVVRNRVADPSLGPWPTTFAAVCLQPKQFSAWTPGNVNLAPMLAVDTTDTIFAQCLDIASGIIDGSIADNTGGAQFYYDDSIAQPSWAATMTPTVKIGALNFFRE